MKNIIILTILLFSLTSCSSNLQLNASRNSFKRPSAILPIEHTASVSQGRSEAIYYALLSSLRAKGFLVLDKNVVEKHCSKYDCTNNIRSFKDKFDIDLLFRPKITTFSTNNFLIGYFNTLSGSVEVLDDQSRILATISASERDSGGIVFQTGQIIKGIKQTFLYDKNQNEESLITNLVEKLISPIPIAKASDREKELISLPPISFAEVKNINSDYYEICFQSISNQSGFLIGENIKISMAETMPGKYCRILNKESLSSSQKFFVEARTAFGFSKRKSITIPDQNVCDLSSYTLTKEKKDNGVTLKLKCSDCKVKTSPCLSLENPESNQLEFKLYRAKAGLPSFDFVGTFTKNKFEDPNGSLNDNYFLILTDILQKIRQTFKTNN